MNKILLCLLAAVLSSALSACATDPMTDGAAVSDASAAAAADDGEERVYVTGSNIPRRSLPGEVKSANKDSIESAVRTTSSVGKGSGGR